MGHRTPDTPAMTHILIPAALAAATVGVGFGLRTTVPPRHGALPVLALISGPIGTAASSSQALAHPAMPASLPTVRVVLASPYPGR
jgi:hypothetical protein